MNYRKSRIQKVREGLAAAPIFFSGIFTVVGFSMGFLVGYIVG